MVLTSMHSTDQKCISAQVIVPVLLNLDNDKPTYLQIVLNERNQLKHLVVALNVLNG